MKPILQFEKLILASSSATRAQMMRAIGLKFDVCAPLIDEERITNQARQNALNLEDIAKLLAYEKFKVVAPRYKNHIVIASDQTLEFNNNPIEKPINYDQAFDQLWALRGQTHYLYSAIAIGRSNDMPIIKAQSAAITMRHYSQQSLRDYLEYADPNYLSSVGGYQIETYGMLLIDHIEGDHTTIMGMPMLILLSALRQLKVIAE
jgi:septum formation protein